MNYSEAHFYQKYAVQFLKLCMVILLSWFYRIVCNFLVHLIASKWYYCGHHGPAVAFLRLLLHFTWGIARGKMYIGHAYLCVSLSLAAFAHYCTDPDVTWRNGRGCLVVVQYWSNLQSVSVCGFRCYDSVAPNAKCQQVREMSASGECLYSLYAWFL